MRKRILAALAVLLLAASPTSAQDRLKVVASFSILADFVRNVGGARTDVVPLVGPSGDAHVYSPSPADAKMVAEAKLIVVNGLGFEGWLDRLMKASGSKAAIAVATRGVKARKATDSGHDHGHGHDADPHAWQSVANAKIYVGNIRDALIKVDPAGAADYQANATSYLARLDALEDEVKQAVAAIPPPRRKIITTHDAFGYFGAAYGMAFIAPQGVATDSEASARDIARIITQIRKEKVPAVFLENVSDARLIRQIADETGARIGGTLYSDALSDDKGPAPTYVDMILNNVGQFRSALGN